MSWAASLAGWFPWLRPEGTKFRAYADEIAAELGANDGEVPAEAIDDGVALLSAAERRRLAETFVSRQPAEWAAVQADVGHLVALEPALVAGAVRVAILERRLPPTLRLDHLERGIAPVRSPRDALAVTLPPETIWSVVDGLAAIQAAAAAETEAEWLRAIMVVAHARIHDAHASRVQALGSSLRRRLPAPGFPSASALLDDAYALAESRRDFAETVALALLPPYVAQQNAHITSTN